VPLQMRILISSTDQAAARFYAEAPGPQGQPITYHIRGLHPSIHDKLFATPLKTNDYCPSLSALTSGELKALRIGLQEREISVEVQYEAATVVPKPVVNPIQQVEGNLLEATRINDNVAPTQGQRSREWSSRTKVKDAVVEAMQLKIGT
jgi:hypothetical protein